ncbi:MAG TPA: Lrp/AsnC family transcriptional regulator [Methanocorpusculum sp.]|nr:Lrp/AsnC family transcriptional regulator [Methanocorpusculum sp.]
MALSADEFEELVETAYTYICKQEGGILQSNLWKELEIDSKVCSKVLKELEDTKRITRTKEKGTYLVKGKIVPKKFNAVLLMAGNSIVPCVACTEECDVPHCKLLEDWIYDLVFSEAK